MRKTLLLLLTMVIAMMTTVALAQQSGSTATDQPVSSTRVIGALALVVIAIGAVWLGARNSTLIRDNLLPQIEPSKQPYSLGRWQMAFWFTLIFSSFVAIYIVHGHYNGVITSQELWLMGISATSGVAAVAVDVAKDSPADAANRGLVALGLTSYQDVERVRQEIADRKTALAANPAPLVAQKLAAEINDRELLLAAYANAIKPYVSEGWYKDLTTDLNGAALHRVQTLAWTITLGVIFAVGVITSYSMPQFDTSLLLLMGISNAGYIGFKYPEPQQ